MCQFSLAPLWIGSRIRSRLLRRAHSGLPCNFYEAGKGGEDGNKVLTLPVARCRASATLWADSAVSDTLSASSGADSRVSARCSSPPSWWVHLEQKRERESDEMHKKCRWGKKQKQPDPIPVECSARCRALVPDPGWQQRTKLSGRCSWQSSKTAKAPS